MNVYLLAPEISIAVFAILIIVVDLVVQDKRVLPYLGIMGFVFSILNSIALWGISATAFSRMLVVDQFSMFFSILFGVIGILVILASMDYVRRFKAHRGEFYAVVMLSTIGMMFMASTGELISIYVSVELASISLYVLASFLKDAKSSEAGLKYFLVGAISSAVLLYGMALIFGLTGKTNLYDIASALPGGARLATSPALLMAVVMLVAGFGFKIATIPFQMWVPDVYEGAPTPVTAFLSVASKAAGFAVILRVFYQAFGPPLSISIDWAMIFAVLSAISMTVGNILAIQQTNIKRMMGYSSIAQAGYVMVGLATLTATGRDGLLFFLASYAVSNLGAFIAIIAISHKLDSDEIKDYTGIARRAPWVAIAFTVCLISLTGVPPSAGFLAKFYIFNAAVQYNLLWLVIFGVLNTAISAFYYVRVIKVMWVGTPASQDKLGSSPAVSAALAISSIVVLALFFLPSSVLQAATNAVALFK